MAARGSEPTHAVCVLRSPHHEDRRSLAELAAIETVDELHVACVQNHRSLIQLHDGKYVLAHSADVVDGVLGVWATTGSADDGEDDEAARTFQPLPFEGGREDSPRLIILGLLQGKFTHTYTQRDYWVTEVESNDCGNGRRVHLRLPLHRRPATHPHPSACPLTSRGA
ncbi:hypothetical protein AB1Y20_006364 [Prymnesium parvum]|uniref:Uncharacterized protein n=1 Tax=Prymnesium parvum TaxID=97485 RepID=A0AB34J4C0_PRYPA